MPKIGKADEGKKGVTAFFSVSEHILLKRIAKELGCTTMGQVVRMCVVPTLRRARQRIRDKAELDTTILPSSHEARPDLFRPANDQKPGQ